MSRHNGTPKKDTMADIKLPTQDEVNKFLDILRESGLTNMVGAGKYIQDRFGVTKYDAQRFLLKWMETFSERQTEHD